MRIEKILAVLVVLIMVFSFVGCGGGSNSDDVKATTFIVGTETAETSNTAKALKNMEEYIETQSDGAIDVQIHYSGVLGSESEMLEQVQMGGGGVNLVLPSSSLFVSYNDKFSIWDIPFLFTSHDAVVNAYKGDLGDEYNSWLEDAGFHCFGIVPTGFRGLSNDKHAVHSPSDMKGLKIRVMESDAYIKTFKMLGANTVTMNYSDVYTALQQRVIDGQDNPPEFTVSSGFYELNKYYTRLNHVMSVMPVVTSSSYWTSLDDNTKAVIEDGVVKMVTELSQSFVDAEEGYIQQMKDAGVEITELTDSEMKTFVDKVKPLHDSYRKSLGDDLIELAMSFSK